MGDLEDMAANAISILKDDATLAKFKKEAFDWAVGFDILKILPLYEQSYEEAYKFRYKNSH